MNKHITPRIIARFAEQLGTEARNGRVDIPANFGKGYCAGYVFNEHLRMIISNYELNEEMMVDNPEIDVTRRMIFFKFQHIFSVPEVPGGIKNTIGPPSVLVATSRINTDEVIAIHSNKAVINIEVDAHYLAGMFEQEKKSALLQSLLKNNQPLLFEQVINASLQRVVHEITGVKVHPLFELYYLKIKAEELICQLLMELEKRGEKQVYALNNDDIQAIYSIKELMLKRLDVPPLIQDIALSANMSPTKLKRMFRQIFGNSIFQYFQERRMEEAARLLDEKRMSVSATGYHLGFSNLGHFARVFQKHKGINPKKYSARLVK